MLFTMGAAGVLATRDKAPVARTAWMSAQPVMLLNRLRLAPGVWIVRDKASQSISALAIRLPYDAEDSAPAHRRYDWPDWHQLAACRETANVDDIFFGMDDGVHPGQPAHPALPPRFFRAARVVCASCPVQVECLTQALSEPEMYGVWAGTTGRQRVALRNQVRDDGDVDKVVRLWLRK